MLKTCTKCGEAHPVEFFNKDRSRGDGVYPQCRNCTRANCKRVYRTYNAKHVALKRAWKAENDEKNRQINRAWRKANPEAVRAGTARYRERLARATPAWADKDEIAAVYANRPEGHHVDHIHPLAGKNFCGLNVPWNLQYLPADVHFRKGTKLPAEAGGHSHL